jgi:hypothetical protein
MSVIERFIIKYDEEFLKHFKGSIIIPIRSRIFENAPINMIIKRGMM